MARIFGTEIPNQKRGEISLSYLFGIGRSLARKVLDASGVGYDKKVKDWTDEELAKVRKVLTEGYVVEGDLRGEIQLNIKRLMDIGSYVGKRHRAGLPVRGQRTRTNARTRKGKPKTVANKKQATKK